jgi:hypothetical protein
MSGSSRLFKVFLQVILNKAVLDLAGKCALLRSVDACQTIDGVMHWNTGSSLLRCAGYQASVHTAASLSMLCLEQRP